MKDIVKFVEAGFNDQGHSVILDKREVKAIHPMPEVPSFSIIDMHYVEDSPLTTQTKRIQKPYDINLLPQSVRFLVCQIPPINVLLSELNNPSIQTPEDFIEKMGMHRTPSVDYFYISKGAVTLYMGNGDQHEFQTGDAFAMRGADHAWVNYADTLCELIGVMIGADS